MVKPAQILLSVIFFFSSVVLPAQEKQLSTKSKKAVRYFKEAETAYRRQEWENAVNALQKALKTDKSFTEAWLMLGDAYSELKENEEAVEAYENAVRMAGESFPRVFYFLGRLNFEEGNYTEAVPYFEKLLASGSATESLKTLGKAGLKRSLFAQSAVENPVGPRPLNLSDSINTENDEFINFVNETGNQLVLTRKYKGNSQDGQSRLFTEGFFRSERKDSAWVKPEVLPLGWQEGLNLGGMSLSVDGREMFFTGCEWPSGMGSCDLYLSRRLGTAWQPPVGLGPAVNSRRWDSQPVISADGKQLLFTSKRAGGKGGADIWMSLKLPDGKWSPPVNLGDSINTPGDETAPFLHADGKTLYFSSTGWTGLGGYDLFVSRKDEAGRWSAAENLGHPVNSKFDEANIFVSLDGSRAWISSNREGGLGGFDIFTFPLDKMAKPDKVLFVKGVVVDAESKIPLAAKIELTNLLNNRVDDSTTSDRFTGEFLMVLHPGTLYAFNITKKAYLFYSETFNLKEADSILNFERRFELLPVRKGKQLVLKNIFFDFNSAELKPASKTELGKLLELMHENPEMRLQIAGHTDSIGGRVYNQKLSEERAFAVYRYLISNGVDASRLEHRGFGDTRPLTSNDTESGRQQNRRTEIKVL